MKGTITVPYRVKPGSGYVIATVGGLFSTIALFTAFSNYGNTAVSDRQGNMVPDFITIWAGVVVFGSLAIYGVRLIRAGRWADRQIMLDDDQIVAPKSALSRQMITINYRDIIKIWWFPKYMGIRHTNGILWMTKACLPDTSAYETIYNRLESQMTA
jgi:hypothetical protein